MSYPYIILIVIPTIVFLAFIIISLIFMYSPLLKEYRFFEQILEGFSRFFQQPDPNAYQTNPTFVSQKRESHDGSNWNFDEATGAKKIHKVPDGEILELAEGLRAHAASKNKERKLVSTAFRANHPCDQFFEYQAKNKGYSAQEYMEVLMNEAERCLRSEGSKDHSHVVLGFHKDMINYDIWGEDLDDSRVQLYLDSFHEKDESNSLSYDFVIIGHFKYY